MLSGLLHYSIAFLYCITLLAVYTQRLALVKRLEAYLKQLSVSSGANADSATRNSSSRLAKGIGANKKSP